MNKRTKYRNASCIIVSRMLGMSGCLPCRGFLAMKTTVKNERTSTIARDVECELYINQNSRCRIVLEDGDAPKATDRLMERRNMDFHSSTPQSLNVSRSISGSGGTKGGSEPACG